MADEKTETSGDLLSWGEGIFCGACRYPVSESCLEQFRRHYAKAEQILTRDPGLFRRIQSQLAYWIERQAYFACGIVDCTRGIEVLPEHFLAANEYVKAWKVDGATSLCNGV